MARTTTTRPDDAAAGAAVPAVPDGAPPTAAAQRRRELPFRVASVLTVLFFTPLLVFGVGELVLVWLPDATVLGIVDDPALAPGDVDLHRTHFLARGVIALALLLTVAVQLRRPERRVASMLLALGMQTTALVVYALAGTFTAWLTEDVLLLAPLLLLALLHPARSELRRVPSRDRTMARMVAVAAGPWLLFAGTNAVLQLRDATGDSHAAMEHWGTVALLASTIVLAGALGASDHSGWRLPAWVAAGGSTIYGVHSLVFPDPASAATPLFAVAAVVWGLAFAGATVQRARHAGPAGV